MSKALFITIGIIAIVAAVIFQIFNPGYSFNPSNPLKNNDSTEKLAFPLDDPNGTYTITRAGASDYRLNYKNSQGVTTVIDIDPLSPADVSSYVGKNVSVEGRIRTVKKEVQCIAAPCNPIEVDLLVITSIDETN